MRSFIRRRLALGLIVGTLVGAAVPGFVSADSYGANSTPGTLDCGSAGFYTMTSGSAAARSLQLSDTKVFVVMGIVDWDFYEGGGTASKWLTCTLSEPGPGGIGTVTVVGIITKG